MGSPAEVRSKRPAIGTPIFLMLSVRPIRCSRSAAVAWMEIPAPISPSSTACSKMTTFNPRARRASAASGHQFRRPRSQLDAALTQLSRRERPTCEALLCSWFSIPEACRFCLICTAHVSYGSVILLASRHRQHREAGANRLRCFEDPRGLLAAFISRRSRTTMCVRL
jgi:hypothetical protein